ncbi:cytochrome c biogenesis CcdA family protein [Albimonas pacifica]|uniref:Cytochrome c-type biogenesis protein n=1 Tax=Albimonas pacifica TaxID=1114924 RepID=A0A1I3GBF0_9RHOB|nr:cytochrome c biogenesis CcdA family protein [Albimonas pacifica]SFI20818.1 cytochrome c-type biogenesis protein [Albimonas pacifica]
MTDIGLLAAFFGGLLSFLSPCVLPLAPPYLAFMAGSTLDKLTGEEEQADAALARRVFISSLFFVAGLGTVFVALGAGASLVGQTLQSWRYEFGIAAGFVIYVMGQHFIGFRRAPLTAALAIAAAALLALSGGWEGFVEQAQAHWPVLAALALLAAALRLSGMEKIPFLMQEARFDAGGAAGSFAGAYVIGLAFAFGWTPCIGPVLGSILFLAAQRETIGEGVGMLAVYALGLGVPFILAAAFVRPFMRWMRGFRRHLGRVEMAMGALLVAVGLLMMTGAFETLAFWLLETFPALATIG